MNVANETELYDYITNHAVIVFVNLEHNLFKPVKMMMRTTNKYLTIV